MNVVHQRVELGESYIIVQHILKRNFVKNTLSMKNNTTPPHTKDAIRGIMTKSVMAKDLADNDFRSSLCVNSPESF